MFDSVTSVVGARLDGRRAGGKELGACESEAAFEFSKVTILHLEHLLVIVLLSEHLNVMSLLEFTAGCNYVKDLEFLKVIM